jgi:hypothetical protein
LRVGRNGHLTEVAGALVKLAVPEGSNPQGLAVVSLPAS